ncbi:alkaline phosphatase family protein [soil metagenome]
MRVDPVRPDYAGAWVGGLVPALLGATPADWLPPPAAAARVVLLVLDGLGWTALADRRHALPELGALQGGAITAAAPTTTAAGLTSIATGFVPAEHGVVGYRMRVAGQVLNVLRWQVPKGGGKPPDPARVQPVPPFLGKSVPVVTRAEFRDTGFTTAHLRDSRFVGWQTTSSLVEHVRRLVVAGGRFVYAYYDGLDKVAHAYGLASGFFDAELAEVDRMIGLLLDRLPEDCALVVTADHGQVDVGPERMLSLAELAPLVQAYSGESRFRSLHARPGAADDLLDVARACFGELAWLFSRDELFDDGWLGEGGSTEVRHRVGDVVLAAHAPVGFADPDQPKESELVSQHGSLTPDEVFVPLLAAHGRGSARR